MDNRLDFHLHTEAYYKYQGIGVQDSNSWKLGKVTLSQKSGHVAILIGLPVRQQLEIPQSIRPKSTYITIKQFRVCKKQNSSSCKHAWKDIQEEDDLPSKPPATPPYQITLSSRYLFGKRQLHIGFVHASTRDMWFPILKQIITRANQPKKKKDKKKNEDEDDLDTDELDTLAHALPTMIDNEIYARTPPNESFKIHVIPTEKARELGLRGRYTLRLTNTAFELLEPDSRSVLHVWPLTAIKRFGLYKQRLYLFCGSQCLEGSGLYIFLMTDIEVLRARLMALTQRPPIGSPLSPRVKSTTTLVPSSQDDFAFLDASTRFDPSDKDLLETGCWFRSDDPRLDHRREDNIRSPPLSSRNDIEQRHPQTLLHCTISPVANSNRQVDHVTIVPREHNDFVYRTSRRICFDKATSVGVEIDSISPTGFTSVVRDGSPVYAEAEEQLNGSGEHNSLITHNNVNDKNGKSDFVRNGRIQIKIPIEGISEAENENTLTPSSIWTHPSKTDISETANCNETEGNASKSGSKQHRITRSNTWDQSNYYEIKDQGERQVKNVELQTDFPSDSECESASKDPQSRPVKRNGDDKDDECDSLTELFTTVF